MNTVYIKVTIPELPEPLRVSINSVMAVNGCPFKTIAKVRRAAAKRGVAAEYDLSTREEYLALRAAHRAEIEAQHAQMAAESRAENAWLTHSENSGFYDDPRGN